MPLVTVLVSILFNSAGVSSDYISLAKNIKKNIFQIFKIELKGSILTKKIKICAALEAGKRVLYARIVFNFLFPIFFGKKRKKCKKVYKRRFIFKKS